MVEILHRRKMQVEAAPQALRVVIKYWLGWPVFAFMGGLDRPQCFSHRLAQCDHGLDKIYPESILDPRNWDDGLVDVWPRNDHVRPGITENFPGRIRDWMVFQFFGARCARH